MEVDDGMSALSSMSAASEGGASERGDCDSGMTLRFASLSTYIYIVARVRQLRIMMEPNTYDIT